MDYAIEKMICDDWNQVRSIFPEGSATGHATFETDSNDWNTWDSNHLCECCLAAKSRETVLEWAAISRVSDRPVYSGAAEVSVYVSKDCRRKGTGSALLKALIKDS